MNTPHGPHIVSMPVVGISTPDPAPPPPKSRRHMPPNFRKALGVGALVMSAACFSGVVRGVVDEWNRRPVDPRIEQVRRAREECAMRYFEENKCAKRPDGCLYLDSDTRIAEAGVNVCASLHPKP